jgi:penicillin-binding protein 2
MKIDAEPGHDVVLTIDVPIQHAAERALASIGPEKSGAVVVMDIHSGDILAAASAPTFDPNYFLNPPTNWNEVLQRWRESGVYLNRATRGTYEPGSTFKIVVALAGLESGLLDPSATYVSAGSYRSGGGRHIDDTAPAGNYDFERAFYKSSNAYFIDCGVRIGHERVVEMGRRFGLGQPTGLPKFPEASGYFPPSPSVAKVKKRDRGNWMQGDTENLSIGHGEVLVTPLQMAVLTAAVANGGKVLRPRLVSAIRSLDDASSQNAETFAAGVTQAQLHMSQRSLNLVREAMLADVENPAGTGYQGSHLSNYKICGKTGTAKITPELRKTWFVSFAPFENPRYTVVVVVEPGVSGGHTCAPIAKKVYEALIKRDQAVQPKAPL